MSSVRRALAYLTNRAAYEQRAHRTSNTDLIAAMFEVSCVSHPFLPSLSNQIATVSVMSIDSTCAQTVSLEAVLLQSPWMPDGASRPPQLSKILLSIEKRNREESKKAMNMSRARWGALETRMG